ncbi:MAG: saccharopine dehydrogenase NADP-binding domain-containing protein [Pseudomonadota bacterium]
MKSRLLIYGVDTYAGGVISRRAAARGFAHVAAGHDIARVAILSNSLSKATPNLVEPRIFGLADQNNLEGQFDDVAVVVNCCPRFSETGMSLIEACLATHTHYLDLCSAPSDLVQVFARNEEAKASGVSLIPGLSFDVSAADTMAARLATMRPHATHLTIAVARSPLSQTEAKAIVKACRQSGEVLKDGKMVAVEAGARSITIDFGQGTRQAYLAPWRAESLIAKHIGPYKNVDGFEVFHPALVRSVIKSGLPRIMFRRGWRIAALERRIGGRGEGPKDKRLAKTSCVIWGEARDAEGRVSRARLETPAAQIYTADVTLALVRIVIDGRAPAGAYFPSQVAGGALVENITGVVWRELPDRSEVVEAAPVPIK